MTSTFDPWERASDTKFWNSSKLVIVLLFCRKPCWSSMITWFKTDNTLFSTIDSNILGMRESKDIGWWFSMLDRSAEDLRISQIKLVFHLSGKKPMESDKLNR